MHDTAETRERLVCAVLAAQVAVIRDRTDTSASVDLLWRTGDVLARLSKLVLDLAHRCPSVDPDLDLECAAAVAAEAEVSSALDALAFLQAQRHDLARQMADCVVTALARLAAEDAPDGHRLSPDDLAALYVCDAQRKTHESIARKFGIDVLIDPPPADAHISGCPLGAET